MDPNVSWLTAWCRKNDGILTLVCDAGWNVKVETYRFIAEYDHPSLKVAARKVREHIAKVDAGEVGR